MKRNERGMVTVELAIASLILVAVAAGMIGVFGVVVAQVRCIDAAAEIARQTSRGDQSAVERITRNTPPNSRVTTVRTTTGMVEVTVTAPVKLMPGWVVTVDVSGRATIPLEPGVR